jgi:hypothetical protein
MFLQNDPSAVYQKLWLGLNCTDRGNLISIIIQILIKIHRFKLEISVFPASADLALSHLGMKGDRDREVFIRP